MLIRSKHRYEAVIIKKAGCCHADLKFNGSPLRSCLFAQNLHSDFLNIVSVDRLELHDGGGRTNFLCNFILSLAKAYWRRKYYGNHPPKIANFLIQTLIPIDQADPTKMHNRRIILSNTCSDRKLRNAQQSCQSSSKLDPMSRYPERA